MINAFLNTGQGGTVYLGIVDSGMIHGLKLTQYQVSLKLTQYQVSLKLTQFQVSSSFTEYNGGW